MPTTAKRGRVGKGRKPVKGKAREELPVDTAFRKIKEMMYHHEIVPGQKLLYQALAKKLGMSITPIIQALNRLQLLNIVYSERNKGFYVGEADPAEARELFIAREAFETFLVPAIIKNLTDEKLERLEKATREHVEAVSTPQYRRILLLKDTNFHLQMIEIAGNRVIHNLCKNIFEQIYLKYRPEYMREERLREATEEHWAIVGALRERDAKKTRRLLKQHVKNGREHIVGSLWRGEDAGLEF
ncbi:MAG: GntR family transcriptional regulator [Deltaproteobacteria bacterium]|nr:GntR family transcriptional regulator [Deltaproteobacteria bacterium]MBW1817563.1 GntR family transcriptional regulator [Deltaproteobacteria bacterium]MBW2284162.1 GntR family transcriptional regulator [Deltaproteobacteria bacterium]